MAYRPILETSQLPPIGPLAEDLRFDMKLKVSVEVGGESDLACDLAAFANSVGGVLLVGAHESPKDSGILSGYRPMTHAQAQDIGMALKRALALCSPKPVAEAKPITCVDGSGYVVAINCDPYGAPPIGVAMPGHGGGEKWWAFPARRGRDTHNLRPEELATIMEPRLRRIALELSRVPTYAPRNLPHAKFHSSSGSIMTLHILAIDADRSSLCLANAQDSQEVIVPLEAVRMIWREREVEIFHVSLSGSIVETSTRELQFHP